jgi:hypothetical protein
LVEKLLTGGGIKVTKGAWQVPKWLAFVASQVDSSCEYPTDITE